LRGTNQNAARLPGQVARQLDGRTFSSFGQFRRAFWRAVADDPQLSRQFGRADLARMRRGAAPTVDSSQSVGGQWTYQLHHVTPINRGGGVYDLNNIVVVTPRYHQSVLEPGYHYGK
jgi:hypothetical protein